MIGFNDIGNADGNGKLNTITVNEYLYEYGKVHNETYQIDGIRFVVYSADKNRYLSLCADLIEYDGMLKIVMINNNDMPNYKRKNIPEHLVKLIANTLNRAVCSSTTLKDHVSYADEFRLSQATKYWIRALELFPENVTIDKEKGIYIYTPDSLKTT